MTWPEAAVQIAQIAAFAACVWAIAWTAERSRHG